jgi:hypothetical protein
MLDDWHAWRPDKAGSTLSGVPLADGSSSMLMMRALHKRHIGLDLGVKTIYIEDIHPPHTSPYL